MPDANISKYNHSSERRGSKGGPRGPNACFHIARSLDLIAKHVQQDVVNDPKGEIPNLLVGYGFLLAGHPARL